MTRLGSWFDPLALAEAVDRIHDRLDRSDGSTAESSVSRAPTRPVDRDRRPAVRAVDLGVRLGGRRVLEDVNLAAAPGSFLAIVGRNGAGKTTLLRTLAAALTPDTGTVEVCGEHIHELRSRAASRLVAAVPQDTSLSFEFDVREAVAMGRTPHVGRFSGFGPADRKAVDRAMERVNVTELADRPVTAVSGGERSRVLLARALAQDTPVILLDEPTGSLDVAHAVRTLSLARGLAAEGRTVIAAIHDLNLAARFADELHLLADGSVLAAGPPETVLTESNLATAFGVRTVVARHPATGSLSVTALPETEGDRDRSMDGPATPAGEGQRRPEPAVRSGRVHVVGDGDVAAAATVRIDAAGHEVTVGPLSADSAARVPADRLGLETVTVPPYAPVDAGANQRVGELVAAADVVVLADVTVSEGNLAVLRSVLNADVPSIFVEGRSPAERNFAGDSGRRVDEQLRNRGEVVDPNAVGAAVESALRTTRQ